MCIYHIYSKSCNMFVFLILPQSCAAGEHILIQSSIARLNDEYATEIELLIWFYFKNLHLYVLQKLFLLHSSFPTSVQRKTCKTGKTELHPSGTT